MNGRTEVGLATAEAMGTELSDPALNLFVEDWWPQSDEAIVRGLTRRVVKFATRMASRRPLLLRTCLSAGVSAIYLPHVVRNPEGVSEERDFDGNRGRVPKPELPPRIHDTVPYGLQLNRHQWHYLARRRERDLRLRCRFRPTRLQGR